ncbi:hypothetical protein HPB48_025955 [Haemaphysalis longicornis]|uniref:PA domain-containing protein n=1 Tax=Haemaphysalis longicornis TaxID=44386 RepID=A0A9J6HA82_HAELO|nr:hypothetical protein HPB48_025955 [Haemaphysalis longicornis]
MFNARNPLDTAVLLVKAADSSGPVVHCAVYVPAIKDVPKREEDAEYRPLVNVLNDSDCDYERQGFEGKVVLMERCDNSSNDDIVLKAKSAKAAAIVMVFNEKRPVRARLLLESPMRRACESYTKAGFPRDRA